jgi:predicted  nucleic acid-binding Zn-ribbon protein
MGGYRADRHAGQSAGILPAIPNKLRRDQRPRVVEGAEEDAAYAGPVRAIHPESVAEPGATLPEMVAKVEPAALRRLLDLQEQDSAIKQLLHRRESLPETQELAEVNERVAELASDMEIATKQFQEAGREQDRLEGEISMIETKISKEEQRMFSGGVSNPKELSALQAEVESLKRRKGGIEDRLLEILVHKDQAGATLESIRDDHAVGDARSKELAAVVGKLTQDIDADLRLHDEQREAIIPDIPADLLSLYDQLRDQKGGIGAAALVGGTCQGCHTKLPATEVERVLAEGGLQRCDNCRRILVVA